MLWFNVTPFAFRFIHYMYAVLSLYMLCGLAVHFLKEHFDCLNQCKRTASINTRRLLSVKSVDTSSRKPKPMLRLSHSVHGKSKFIRISPLLMAGLSFLAAILTILHILLDLWVFFFNHELPLKMLCVRQKWSGIVLFSCAFFVYLFLWIRQRVFYSHPILKKLSGPGLNFLSWSVLFAIVFSLTSITVVYYTMSFDLQLDSERKKEITYTVFYNSSGEILSYKLVSVLRGCNSLCHSTSYKVLQAYYKIQIYCFYLNQIPICGRIVTNQKPLLHDCQTSVVRASTSLSIKKGFNSLIKSYQRLKKTVFTASVLNAYQETKSVRKMPASSLIGSLSKALNQDTSMFMWQTQVEETEGLTIGT